MHPNQVSAWKRQALDGLSEVFSNGANRTGSGRITRRKTATSTPHPEHRIYPYWLRSVVATRPDRVWSADISYIPVRRGCCQDNIFIEQLWRSLKYEAIYLHESADGFVAEHVIAEWIGFYNAGRPHSSLNGATPAEFYAANRPVDMMDNANALPTSLHAQQQQKAFAMERVLAA